jgi:hypothetical protein
MKVPCSIRHHDMIFDCLNCLTISEAGASCSSAITVIMLCDGNCKSEIGYDKIRLAMHFTLAQGTSGTVGMLQCRRRLNTAIISWSR